MIKLEVTDDEALTISGALGILSLKDDNDELRTLQKKITAQHLLQLKNKAKRE